MVTLLRELGFQVIVLIYPILFFYVKAAYLFAWLLLLRIEEVIRIDFESIDIIPGERELNFCICPLILYADSELLVLYR